MKVLDSGSKVRLVVEIIGLQGGGNKETVTSGGIVLTGDATKQKDAEYGNLARVIETSDENDPVKVGSVVTLSKRSGRSAIQCNDKTVYLINRDEIWTYDMPDPTKTGEKVQAAQMIPSVSSSFQHKV